MTTLKAAFESKLALKDEGYESGSKISTYSLPSGEPPEYTMFWVMRMSLLIQQHHVAQVPASHIANLSDSD